MIQTKLILTNMSGYIATILMINLTLNTGIWSNNMDEGYIGKFRGIPVTVKPDAEIAEIVLPKSLATHILQLQDDKMEHLRKELKSMFPNLYDEQEQLND